MNNHHRPYKRHSAMPRFLSRSPTAHRPHQQLQSGKCTTLLSSSFHRGRRYSSFTAWFETTCLEEMRKLSNPSLTTTLSGEQTCSNDSLVSDNKETKAENPSFGKSSESPDNTSDGSDNSASSSWGIFIDPAAEETRVRSRRLHYLASGLDTVDEMSSSSEISIR